MAQINTLENIEIREPIPGYKGKFIHSERMTFVYWDIEENAPLPRHSHEHEQVVNVLEGTYKMIVDDIEYLLKAGDILTIPSNAEHWGNSITKCKIIDVFAPVREDYIL